MAQCKILFMIIVLLVKSSDCDMDMPREFKFSVPEYIPVFPCPPAATSKSERPNGALKKIAQQVRDKQSINITLSVDEECCREDSKWWKKIYYLQC